MSYLKINLFGNYSIVNYSYKFEYKELDHLFTPNNDKFNFLQFKVLNNDWTIFLLK